MFGAFVLLIAMAPGWATPVGLPNAPLVNIAEGQLRPFWNRPKSQGVKPLPIHVSPFRMMVYPVTNAQFIEFLKRHPEWQRSRVLRLFADGNYLKQFVGDLKLKKGMSLQSPVTYVSWFAAKEYCESLGWRLPTMMEWEYVAAADQTHADATKDPQFLARILEWYSQPQGEGALPDIGRRSANFYRVHDLHGLVWEWVDDFNSNLITGESRTDGSLDKNLFCGAGGMSGSDKENYAAFMRFAFRSSLKGAMSIWNLGFRCATEVSH